MSYLDTSTLILIIVGIVVVIFVVIPLIGGYEIFKSVSSWFSGVSKNISSNIQGVLNLPSQAISNAQQAVNSAYNYVTGSVSGIANSVYDYFTPHRPVTTSWEQAYKAVGISNPQAYIASLQTQVTAEAPATTAPQGTTYVGYGAE